MHINDIDLNLLRVFDGIYRARNVSRAAELLDMAQPATSQALSRLRLLLKDPLFVRVAGGVAPTPRAHRLAHGVQSAIATLEAALNEQESFDPRSARSTLRLHLSDIGEARFLPQLIGALTEEAPSMRVESRPFPHEEIALALDSGALDFAIGFLPTVHDTERVELLTDRYIVLLREAHPFVSARRNRAVKLDALAELEYVAVRSHSETIRILQLLRLEHRVRLTTAHFLALPAIVRTTDLGVVMPRAIATGFVAAGGHIIIEPQLPVREFTVSLHWSRRYENDPAHRWSRSLIVRLFKERGERRPPL